MKHKKLHSVISDFLTKGRPLQDLNLRPPD